VLKQVRGKRWQTIKATITVVEMAEGPEIRA
jgi:hypothetical protein